MSRYSTRKLDNKSRMLMMLMKLLGANLEPSLFGHLKYTMKSGESIIFKPHWISEAW